MTGALLPAEFADLEPFAPTWCLPTEPERWAQRLASTMEEMQAFYDACFPRAEEAIQYCDRFELDDTAGGCDAAAAAPALARARVLRGRGLATAAARSTPARRRWTAISEPRP